MKGEIYKDSNLTSVGASFQVLGLLFVYFALLGIPAVSPVYCSFKK